MTIFTFSFVFLFADINFSYIDFINQVLSVGRISFTLDEVVEKSGYDRKIAQVSLSRLISKGKILLIRRGFYVIITPEFSIQRNIPYIMYIDELMKYLQRNYYVSLLSAAALHGAAHQQPMQFFVTTTMPFIRDIKKEKIHISFTIKNSWDTSCITQLKTRTGYVNVSTAEATILDLVENLQDFGLGRVIGIIDELSEVVNKNTLKKIAGFYPTSVVQRVGYILDDLLGREDIAKCLFAVLSKRNIYPQYLSLSTQKNGSLSDKWKIIPNDKIEIDI